jgi:hypothetical protein
MRCLIKDRVWTVASCLQQTCLLHSLESSQTLSSVRTVLPYCPDSSCCLCWAVQNLLEHWWASRHFHRAVRTVNWGFNFCWVVNCTESFKILEIDFLMLVTLILVILRPFHSWELNFDYSGKLWINTASLFQQHTHMAVINTASLCYEKLCTIHSSPKVHFFLSNF